MKTRVPAERPTRIVQGIHGTLELFAALSSEHEKAGERLRSERIALGLSLNAAARLLEVSTVDLSECERGVRELDVEEALALLRKAKRA